MHKLDLLHIENSSRNRRYNMIEKRIFRDVKNTNIWEMTDGIRHSDERLRSLLIESLYE